MTAAGIVLCGGRSSRMGRAKARLPWRGQPLVAHVVARLREVTDEVVVVGTPGLALPPLEAQVVEDREPGLGPLAGIREGLCRIESELAFVTATDAPFLTAALVRSLLAFGKAAAPIVDGRVQTLAAVYPRALAERAAALLDEGRLRPLHLLEAADYLAVDARALPDAGALRGFNTPEEYLQAVRAEQPGAQARVELGRGVRDRGPARCEVPIGRLAEVLRSAGVGATDERLLPVGLQVSLDALGIADDARIPVGPGECVRVAKAAG